MKPADAINIEDLHRIARRRTPKVAFDYFEGGAEDERGLARNEDAFRHWRLLPRYLVDVSQIDQSTTLFGRRYDSPFGISPTGVNSLLRHGGERMLAEAAAAANIPYTLSGLGTARLEDIAQAAPQHAWFQLYGARERRISEDQIRRAADAGMNALMFTVDVPVLSKRERDLRNGFGRPRLPLRVYLEALRHPAWLYDYFRRGGMPYFETWADYGAGGKSAKAVLATVGANFPAPDQTWRDAEAFRRLWKGPFILKGILHPDDAVRAAELGADGVVVSNHGARQLDLAPTALEMLPLIKAAVGERLALLIDSGFRRGSHIVMARALGAQMVFLGRPVLYGMAAFGRPGAARAIEILRHEVEVTLKQIGCPSLELLGPQFLREAKG
jgi:isopentenyl diphosphate isomerase/L-lactate dehydrogenase-like FMN-dependent dehydrogenase